MNYVVFTILLGIGATAFMDLWGVIRKPLLGVAPPDYALVGRWIAHMTRGRFHHKSISAAALVRGELIIGWIAHYLIGVIFAALLIRIWGPAWIQHPTIGPALIVGIGTVTAPFLLMQPGMGAGIAASKAANPVSAQLQSLITHGVFGIGLYVTGQLLNAICSR